jgi:hypothetical protein
MCRGHRRVLWVKRFGASRDQIGAVLFDFTLNSSYSACARSCSSRPYTVPGRGGGVPWAWGPRYDGRLRLNPLVHPTCWGPYRVVFSFGWSKPIAIDPPR